MMVKSTDDVLNVEHADSNTISLPCCSASTLTEKIARLMPDLAAICAYSSRSAAGML